MVAKRIPIQTNHVYTLKKVNYSRTYKIEDLDNYTFPSLSKIKRLSIEVVKGYLWIPPYCIVKIIVLNPLDGLRLEVRIRQFNEEDREVDTFLAAIEKSEFLNMIGTE